ncbi:MAG: ribosomal RNA small subunit methyltransferase A [Spirochaetales bacterium]|nr:ribosomal RNA small subunit methyltransferase A [Spirochaetales bacterium]
MNDNSPSEIRNILKENNLSLKKRWGQNFLVSAEMRKKIIRYVNPQKNEVIWEIGPGLGALTGPLLSAGARVVAFEIDFGLVSYLKTRFEQYRSFTMVRGDIVKTWGDALNAYGMPAKVFGNLPYASASAIILSFITKNFLPPNLYITVQKESADRMYAMPGTRAYSSFSILFRYSFSIKERFHLKPSAFYPVPEVMSTFLHAIPSEYTLTREQKNFFFEIVRCAFRSRRKTLINNLIREKNLRNFSKAEFEIILGKEGLAADTRSESLSVDEFIRLALRLYDERTRTGSVE